MKIHVLEDKPAVGKAAAERAAQCIQRAISENGTARIVAATGASMFEFLEALVASPGIAWSKVEMFHLDEYVGLSADHPASFCGYLQQRLIRPAGIRKYHLLDGTRDPVDVCRIVGDQLLKAPIDVAFVGIGENGHLAFNDPPADFETDEPYIVVELDEACRRQQLGEGWFATLDDVPKKAISMSIRQILRALEIVCVVPEERKAEAVRKCFTGEVTPEAPASILRTHLKTDIYLDKQSAGLIDVNAILPARGLKSAK